MLQFLRKHQKYFFIVITTTIIITFCFFGVSSSMGQQEAVPDREIGKGVLGKPIMQQELAALCRLIETSPFDRIAWEKGGLPNFFNDGVIEKDFLSSGLGVMLAKRYFEDLKPDLDARLKKIQRYKPYVHPRSSQISAEATWARYSPRLLECYRQLRAKSDQSTTETLALMGQLYIQHAMLPSDVLKQILSMQQNQMGVPADPILANGDLSIFGFKDMEDWFGPKFVSLVGQFIINAAQLAEQKGYVVKTEEIRSDLYQNIFRGYQQISQQSQLSAEEVEHYYQNKMRGLGFDENMLLKAWKKVMLFRRLFEDGSGSVLIDPLAYQQFEEFSKENVKVILYQLPSELQFGDFRTMLKFQTYLESVASDASKVRGDLRMPKQLASLEQIEKRTPELVERPLEVQWSFVKKEELCGSLSVKETWSWETEAAHWEILKKNFPELSQGPSDTASLRLSILNKLDEKQRSKIDQFARLKMIEAQPEKIKLALEVAPVKTSSVSLRMKGGTLPFPELKESAELVALLEGAALSTEAPNAASERLSYYSPDGNNFFKIQVLGKGASKAVLTFAEALKDGTLDRLLDKRLEDSYPDARKKDASNFQMASGQWKPFKEVKDQIGKHVYADLLKSIEDNYRSHYGVLPGREGELPLNFYSNARMLSHMKEAQSSLQSNPEAHFVKLDSDAVALSGQWLLEKAEKTMERCEEVPYSKEEMFTIEAQQWSKVNTGDRGALAFYYIKERSPFQKPPVQSVAFGHQVLAHDAKRDMMLHILQKIQQNESIDLSVVIASKESP